MNLKIKALDYAAEYLPFEFKGFWDKGYCFIKVEIKENKIVFLCTQLPNYTGTSITNSVEDIFNQCISKLIAENIIEIELNLSILEKIFLKQNSIEENKKKEIFNFFRKNSLWIEHYPPGLGIVDAGSYSIVNFSELGEPTWNYLSKENLQNKIGDSLILSIDYEKLKNV